MEQQRLSARFALDGVETGRVISHSGSKIPSPIYEIPRQNIAIPCDEREVSLLELELTIVRPEITPQSWRVAPAANGISAGIAG